MTRKALRQSGRNADSFIGVEEYETWQSRLTWTVGLTTVAGLPLTFSGLYWVTDSLLNASLFTLVAAVVCFAIMAWLLDTYPRAPKRDRGKIFLVVGVPGLFIVLCTSTTWAALTVASPAAMKLDMQSKIELAESDLAKISERRAAEAAVIPQLETQAKDFEARRDGELAAGEISGIQSDEPGKTANDLGAIARSYRAAAQMVTDDQARLNKARTDAETALKEMRKVAEETEANRDSIRDGLSTFAERRREFGLGMGELGRSVLDGSALLVPLDAAIAQQAATTASAQSEKRRKQQADARATVAQLAADAREEAEAAITAARPDEPFKPGDYQVAGPIEAVGQHLGEVAYTLAPPLAADLLLPLLCLFALSYSRSRLETDASADAEDHWSARDHYTPETNHAPQSTPAGRLAKLETARQNLRGDREG